jgi:hypothetical protein
MSRYDLIGQLPEGIARYVVGTLAGLSEYRAYASEREQRKADKAERAARNSSLSDYAERVVRILIDMNAPGCQWLSLVPKEESKL